MLNPVGSLHEGVSIAELYLKSQKQNRIQSDATNVTTIWILDRFSSFKPDQHALKPSSKNSLDINAPGQLHLS